MHLSIFSILNSSERAKNEFFHPELAKAHVSRQLQQAYEAMGGKNNHTSYKSAVSNKFKNKNKNKKFKIKNEQN